LHLLRSFRVPENSSFFGQVHPPVFGSETSDTIPDMNKLALLVAVAAIALSQSQPSRSERFRQMSEEAEKKGLAEPFKGVTTDRQVVPGLFKIQSTGVSTEPVRKAADAFLASLTPDQRKATKFSIDDPEWRKWMNQHFYIRQGVSFQSMNESQREMA